jgi:hypothetical protein
MSQITSTTPAPTTLDPDAKTLRVNGRELSAATWLADNTAARAHVIAAAMSTPSLTWRHYELHTTDTVLEVLDLEQLRPQLLQVADELAAALGRGNNERFWFTPSVVAQTAGWQLDEQLPRAVLRELQATPSTDDGPGRSLRDLANTLDRPLLDVTAALRRLVRPGAVYPIQRRIDGPFFFTPAR